MEIGCVCGIEIVMNIDGVIVVIFCELGFLLLFLCGFFCFSRFVGVLVYGWE